MFGRGHDLRIVSDCNILPDCFSNLGGSYDIDEAFSKERRNNYLAGSEKFRIIEMEVYQVDFD